MSVKYVFFSAVLFCCGAAVVFNLFL